MKKLFLCGALLFAAASTLPAQPMNLLRMDRILHDEAGEIDGDLGAWTLLYGDRFLVVLTDELANRMRIFTPVIAEDELKEDQWQALLEANFHSALDAKYGLYNGYVVSVFTHPLRELTELQLVDALQQVVTLADTFGTTYSSTDLLFGKGLMQETDPPRPRINVKPGGGRSN